MNNELIERIDFLQKYYPRDAIGDLLRDCKAALTQQHEEICRLEGLLDTEPYPSADAYDSACDQLDAWHMDRAKKGLPMLCEGSLVDGLSSILHRFDVLEDEVGKLSRHPLTQQQEAEPVEFDDWPEYHEQAMGCGLEDLGITDRYEAMRYGWDEALDRVAERLPAIHPPAAQPQVPEWYQLAPLELEATVVGKIVDTVFDGCLEDWTVISDIWDAVLSAAKEEGK